MQGRGSLGIGQTGLATVYRKTDEGGDENLEFYGKAAILGYVSRAMT